MQTALAFQIHHARSAADVAAVADLFAAYAASLDVDLAYQNFGTELARLPDAYAPPAGALLLARDATDQPVGCVGLRPSGADVYCEMKRLYVAPEGRGMGIGAALIEAVVQEAKRIGYRAIRLDTLPSMRGAQQLYRKAGFRPISPYYDTPVAGTVFLCLPLAE